MKFRFLVFLIFVFAMIAASATFLSQTTYFLCCVTAPTFLAIGARYFEKWNHLATLLLATASSVFLGSVLLAYGSYYQTFIRGNSGFLIGDGWNSVAASAIVGAAIGIFFGLISLAIYFIAALTIPRQSSRKNSIPEPKKSRNNN